MKTKKLTIHLRKKQQCFDSESNYLTQVGEESMYITATREKKWTSRESKTDLAEIRTSKPISGASAGFTCVIPRRKPPRDNFNNNERALIYSIAGNTVVIFLLSKLFVYMYDANLDMVILKYNLKTAYRKAL